MFEVKKKKKKNPWHSEFQCQKYLLLIFTTKELCSGLLIHHMMSWNESYSMWRMCLTKKKKETPPAAQIWAPVSNGSLRDDSRLQPTHSERDLNKWNKERLLPQVWLHS